MLKHDFLEVLQLGVLSLSSKLYKSLPITEIKLELKKDITQHYDLRIALILVVFLGVCLASGFKGQGAFESSSAKPMCQQMEFSPSHLVSVDCDVIVNAPVENGRSPNMAVFLFDPISINQASYELLQTVRGVGPKLAQKIITYRAQVGPFVSRESIEKITGVGEKRAQYLATQFSFN
jgi:competence ComEA-like helix-hairpin-helix protein